MHSAEGHPGLGSPRVLKRGSGEQHQAGKGVVAAVALWLLAQTFEQEGILPPSVAGITITAVQT